MLKTKGWLPEGTTEDELPDSAFAWLSHAYLQGEESKTDGRKLPYKLDGAVDVDGWKAAWDRAHQMADDDFAGGPSKGQVIAKLLKDKPDSVDVEDDGKSRRPTFFKNGLQLEVKTFSFKAETASDENELDPNCFQGYAAVFGNVDSYGDIIAKGAFKNTITRFLQRGTVCWQHEWWNPIGKPLEMEEDDKGLFTKARISQTTLGKDVLTLMRDDVVQELSIGFIANGWKVLTDEEGEELLGKDEYATALRNLPWWSDGIRLLTDITLYEYSPVTVAANEEALITGVKNGLPAGLKLDEQFEAVLAAVSDMGGRFEKVLDLRQKAGRTLSSANVDKLTTMRDSLSSHVDTLAALIESADPDDDNNEGDPEEDEIDELGKGSGVPVETKDESDPEAVEANRKEYNRFLMLESRRLGVNIPEAA